MNPEQAMTSRRKWILAGAMGAVLLVSVALAWMVTHQKKQLRASATDALGTLRQEGLSAYYSRSVEWYVIRIDGADVGWAMRATEPAQDGSGFFGAYLVVTGTTGICELWTLTEDASTGSYKAGDLAMSAGQSLELNPDTTIVQEDGQLTVTQSFQGRRVISKAAVPETYMPEGSSRALLTILARSRNEAQVNMVLNQAPPVGDRPQFIDFRIEGLDPGGDTAAQATLRARMQASRGGGFEADYHLDAQGRIVEVRRPDMVQTRVTPKELDKRFKRARSQALRLLDKEKSPTVMPILVEQRDLLPTPPQPATDETP